MSNSQTPGNGSVVAGKGSTAAITKPSGDARSRTLSSANKKKSGSAFSSGRLLNGDGFLGKAVQFLREVKVELKKVAWPSRKQTVGSTIVVLVLVIIVALFLGIVDMGLSSLVQVVLK